MITKQHLFMNLTAIRNFIDEGKLELANRMVDNFNENWNEFFKSNPILEDESAKPVIIEKDEI